MKRKINTDPMRKVVGTKRRVLGEIDHLGEKIELAVMDELLECGHSQSPRQDIYGETIATKRRCYQCGASSSPEPEKEK